MFQALSFERDEGPDEETGGGAEGSMRSMGWVDAGKKYIHYAFFYPLASRNIFLSKEFG